MGKRKKKSYGKTWLCLMSSGTGISQFILSNGEKIFNLWRTSQLSVLVSLELPVSKSPCSLSQNRHALQSMVYTHFLQADPFFVVR